MDRNFWIRLATSIVFVIVVVGCIVWSPWSVFGLFLVITVIGLWEFYTLGEKTGAEPQKVYGMIVGGLLLVIAIVYKGYDISYPAYLVVPLFFLVFLFELFRKKSNPLGNISWTIGGLIYIVTPVTMILFGFLPLRFAYSNGIDYSQVGDGFYGKIFPVYRYQPLLFFIILIWTSDTMAYVCGRLFGKHKLFERISPKKTWEGFIGGMIFTGVVGFSLVHFFSAQKSLRDEITWMIAAMIISVTGTMGDLVESLLKRSAGVKDSGNILPGHGGILDRFDALLIATPFTISAFWIYNAIVVDFFTK